MFYLLSLRVLCFGSGFVLIEFCENLDGAV